jgi:hypothetical protein
MGRTIVVGDVHGCRAELEDLLARIGFAEGDLLFVVGDLATRGPEPHGTVALLRALGARGVRGNHEDRLLAYLDGLLGGGDAYSPMLSRPAAEVTADDVAYLRALPLWLEVPEHELLIVHAGLVPGVPLHEQRPEDLMYLRTLGQRQRKVLWGTRYDGPPHVVFGHHAVEGLQLHSHATGLDTGCVYGGRLSALVLREGEKPPRARDRLDAIVSVPARDCYVRPA